VKRLRLFKDYKKLLFLILFVFSIVSSVLILTYGKSHNFDNSLSLMASQFAKGHISFEYTKDMPLGDISKFNGKFYLFYAPFPSIALIPFVVLFGKSFPQISLGLFSMLISFWGIFSIAKHFKFSKIDSLLISLFFVFSTVLFSASVINISAYQVEAFGFCFIVLALREYFGNKRSLFIGLLLGLAFLTRPNLILAFSFFIFELLQKRITLKDLAKILIPIIFCIAVFAGYNFIRFHSFFETGYEHSVSLGAFQRCI
jgi:4-amino-4-deoxy-L-arabinose transferase-like glycosyltransferase